MVRGIYPWMLVLALAVFPFVAVGEETPDADAPDAAASKSEPATEAGAEENRAEAPPVRERTIAEKLGDVVSGVQIENAPAERAFQWFADVSEIPVVINWEQMELEGIDRQTPITINLNRVPAGALLALMMEQLAAGLGQEMLYEATPWYVRLMTKAQANKQLVLRVYDIRDLLHMPPDFTNNLSAGLDESISRANDGGGGGFWPGGRNNDVQQPPMRTTAEAAAELIALTQDTIEPEVWQPLGGPATIRYLRGNLIVNAPRYVQQQIGGATGAAPVARRSRAASPPPPTSRYYRVQPPVRPVAGQVSGVQKPRGRAKVSAVRPR